MEHHVQHNFVSPGHKIRKGHHTTFPDKPIDGNEYIYSVLVSNAELRTLGICGKRRPHEQSTPHVRTECWKSRIGPSQEYLAHTKHPPRRTLQ